MLVQDSLAPAKQSSDTLVLLIQDCLFS